jgi:hypothetical protein
VFSAKALARDGVPQGSVLGPILLIFINDIDDEIESRILKCADEERLLNCKKI